MRLPFILVALLLAAPALAHTGHGTDGFGAGFAHPFGGLDHLLAMVAVGVWAAVIGGPRRWIWPATFVAAMAAGALLGHAALLLPGMEIWIALSVVALGVALALAWPAAPALGAAVIAGCGIAHGWAHGAEAPLEGFGAYAAGFLIATILLHALGLALGQAKLPRAAFRIAGAAIALAGGVIAVGAA